jgi:hypothetical protein
MNMITKVITEYFERFLQLLGRDVNTGLEHCLSDTDIANLIDDKVRKRERKRFHQHLNHCAECYHLWTETAAFVKSFETESEISTANKASASPHFFSNLLFSPIKWAPVVGAAAVLLVLFWPGSNHYPENIDAAYTKLALQDQQQIKTLAQELSTQTQSNTMAFSQAAPNPSETAFAAGLKDGIQKLLPEKIETLSQDMSATEISTKYEDDQNVYFQFGRWVALAWISAQLHDGAVDWRKMQAMLAEIQIQFTRHAGTGNEDSIVTEEIQRLQPLLEQTAAMDAKARKSLIQTLSMTIAKLTPS